MSKHEVDAWFAEYDLPQKALMQAVRAVMLGADVRLGETIKWKTPTFTCNGNLASFNPPLQKACQPSGAQWRANSGTVSKSGGDGGGSANHEGA